VAVRSSATAEDLPDASFAGQQETYLNVHGPKAVLEACHKCFASLFTDRAISYRHQYAERIDGFDEFSVALSVGVQKMVRSDLASSGVMFSIDTETGFKNAALVTGAYGLGENVVQGAVNPDEFFVFKPTLKDNKRPILGSAWAAKKSKWSTTSAAASKPRTCPVAEPDRKKFCVTDDEVLTLAKWACIIEDHYSAHRGKPTPMDIEWAKDGLTGELFIVQARPKRCSPRKRATSSRTTNSRGRARYSPPVGPWAK
jgi:pyruvate,water dikinase